MANPTSPFHAARDLLLAHHGDQAAACREFRWPEVAEFNWAIDHFDAIAASDSGQRPALWIVQEDGSDTRSTFAELSRRSDAVANWLRSLGVRRGDRMILMLGNQVELWETMLAAIKLGAAVIPATPQLSTADIADRLERGRVRHVVARAADADKFSGLVGDRTRIAVGNRVDGWHASCSTTSASRTSRGGRLLPWRADLAALADRPSVRVSGPASTNAACRPRPGAATATRSRR